MNTYHVIASRWSWERDAEERWLVGTYETYSAADAAADAEWDRTAYTVVDGGVESAPQGYAAYRIIDADGWQIDRHGQRVGQRPVDLPAYPPSHDDWLTTAQVAELLGVQPAYVRRLIADGRIPSVKPGHDRLVRRSDVERHQQKRRPVGRPARNEGPEPCDRANTDFQYLSIWQYSRRPSHSQGVHMGEEGSTGRLGQPPAFAQSGGVLGTPPSRDRR